MLEVRVANCIGERDKERLTRLLGVWMAASAALRVGEAMLVIWNVIQEGDLVEKR